MWRGLMRRCDQKPADVGHPKLVVNEGIPEPKNHRNIQVKESLRIEDVLPEIIHQLLNFLLFWITYQGLLYFQNFSESDCIHKNLELKSQGST